MEAFLLYWLMIIVATIPAALFLIVWRKTLIGRKSERRVSLVLMGVATLSYAWLVLAMAFNDVFLGSSYSTLRYAIIDLNFVATVVCSIAAAWAPERMRVFLVVSSGVTAFVWGVVGAINAAV
jgi:hypothetical protein